MSSGQAAVLPAGISDESMFLYRKTANPQQVDFRQRPKHDHREKDVKDHKERDREREKEKEKEHKKQADNKPKVIGFSGMPSLIKNQFSGTPTQNSSNTSVLKARMAALRGDSKDKEKGGDREMDRDKERDKERERDKEKFRFVEERSDDDKKEHRDRDREKEKKKHHHKKEDEVTRRRKQDALLDLMRLSKRCNLSRSFTMEDSYSEIAHERDRHQISLDIADRVSTGRNYVMALAIALFMVNKFLGNKIALDGWPQAMQQELGSGNYDATLEQLYRSMHKSGPPSVTSSLMQLFVMSIISTHMMNKFSKNDGKSGATSNSANPSGGGGGGGGGGFNLGSMFNMLGGLVGAFGGGGSQNQNTTNQSTPGGSGFGFGAAGPGQSGSTASSPSQVSEKPSTVLPPKQRIIKPQPSS